MADGHRGRALQCPPMPPHPAKWEKDGHVKKQVERVADVSGNA